MITAPSRDLLWNLTEVIIVTGKQKCCIAHEHFNRKHDHIFKISYSIAAVYFADKKIIISDKEVGKLVIPIDGKKYSLRK